MQPFSSGDEAIDELIDGVRAGDNLVWIAAPEVDLSPYVTSFLRAGQRDSSLLYVALDDLDGARERVSDSSDGHRQLVWCSDLGHPHQAADVDLTPVDCGDSLPHLRATLEALPAFRQRHARHVIDGLTAAQERFGEQEALNFFLWACPLLYRRRSIAFWTVRGEAHRPSFLSRLREITQVVLHVTATTDGIAIEVQKADGRAADVAGRVLRWNNDGTVRSRELAEFASIGAAIRREREASGFTLADVGRAAGVSASAISQAERGVRGLSGATLTRVWRALGVSFGPTTTGDQPQGHRVLRRSARRTWRAAPGLLRESLLNDERNLDVTVVTLEPGATGRGSPLPTKRPELLVVLGGIAELEFDRGSTTLHEGDACLVTESNVTGWSNPGTTEARLLWLVLPAD